MQVEEIKIPFEWGHIAGKWWGPRNVRPILLLHGWQENAGTFDRLIPLLPAEFSYLAIDFPGHGCSSHLPNHLFYSYMDFVYHLNFIRDRFNWKRLSLLSHSMGSIIAFIYAGIFPDRVDLLIGIDIMQPNMFGPELKVNLMNVWGDKLLRISNGKANDARNYTRAEAIERLVTGSMGSVMVENASFLFKRCVKPAPDEPHKYSFTRDIRTKYINEDYFDRGICRELAKRIHVPYLYLETGFFRFSANTAETVNVWKKTNANFEWHKVDGTHHVHLNTPERIADIIANFLRKHFLSDNEIGQSKL